MWERLSRAFEHSATLNNQNTHRLIFRGFFCGDAINRPTLSGPRADEIVGSYSEVSQLRSGGWTAAGRGYRGGNGSLVGTAASKWPAASRYRLEPHGSRRRRNPGAHPSFAGPKNGRIREARWRSLKPSGAANVRPHDTRARHSMRDDSRSGAPVDISLQDSDLLSV